MPRHTAPAALVCHSHVACQDAHRAQHGAQLGSDREAGRSDGRKDDRRRQAGIGDGVRAKERVVAQHQRARDLGHPEETGAREQGTAANGVVPQVRQMGVVQPRGKHVARSGSGAGAETAGARDQRVKHRLQPNPLLHRRPRVRVARQLAALAGTAGDQGDVRVGALEREAANSGSQRHARGLRKGGRFPRRPVSAICRTSSDRGARGCGGQRSRRANNSGHIRVHCPQVQDRRRGAAAHHSCGIRKGDLRFEL